MRMRIRIRIFIRFLLFSSLLFSKG